MRTWLDPIATRSIVPSCSLLILRMGDVLLRDSFNYCVWQVLIKECPFKATVVSGVVTQPPMTVGAEGRFDEAGFARQLCRGNESS
jgi:hypothetical protein